MFGKITPEFAIQWTKWGTTIIFAIPPNSKASRFTKISFQMARGLSMIIAIMAIIFGLNTAWTVRKSSTILMSILTAVVTSIDVFAKMIIAKVHHHRLQCLMYKLDTFIKNARAYERQVLMDYVERGTPFQFTYNILSLIGSLLYAFSPFITGQPFPSPIQFPFLVDKHPVYDIIYSMQVINTIQNVGIGFFLFQLSIFLCYGAIQLDILADKMKNVNSVEKLKEHISTHQSILRDIDDTIKTMRPVIVTAVVATTIIAVLTGTLTIRNESMVYKAQFALISVLYCFELLSVAWAAEVITTASEGVGWALYNSPWIEKSHEFKATVLLVMHRCQKPPVIRIDGFLPKLSMSYYASYISVTYSAFNTLRAMTK